MRTSIVLQVPLIPGFLKHVLFQNGDCFLGLNPSSAVDRPCDLGCVTCPLMATVLFIKGANWVGRSLGLF